MTEADYAAQFALESAGATFAFGRQVLAMLFLAHAGGWLVYGGATYRYGLALAIAATAAAYTAQMLYTFAKTGPAAYVHGLCLMCAGVSGLLLLRAG